MIASYSVSPTHTFFTLFFLPRMDPGRGKENKRETKFALILEMFYVFSSFFLYLIGCVSVAVTVDSNDRLVLIFRQQATLLSHRIESNGSIFQTSEWEHRIHNARKIYRTNERRELVRRWSGPLATPIPLLTTTAFLSLSPRFFRIIERFSFLLCWYYVRNLFCIPRRFNSRLPFPICGVCDAQKHKTLYVW